MKLPPGLKYFVLAGLVGLAAVFLIQRYISSRVATKPKPRPTAQVVVAQLDIAPGEPLESRKLQVSTWPLDIIPPKTVSNPQQLNGRVALMAISKGEPILESKLAPVGTAAGLSGLLDSNMLALTVKTDEVSGVAGFVNPGDRIDVLVELPKGGGHDGKEHFSKIILQNLKVLSKGQVWDQTVEKKPKVVPTVTLEVTPEQAEMLNLATNEGKIRLALRNQGNRAYFATKGVDTLQLLNKPPVAPVETLHRAKKPESGPRAQLIKGMQVIVKEF
jgi:pilus assembly protein CpaB